METPCLDREIAVLLPLVDCLLPLELCLVERDVPRPQQFPCLKCLPSRSSLVRLPGAGPETPCETLGGQGSVTCAQSMACLSVLRSHAWEMLF